LFAGGIAQVAIFTNSFSAAQVQALYRASLSTPPIMLNLVQAGAGNLTLTWSQGTLLQATNLDGPWTTNAATSLYSPVPTNAQTFFKILGN
jgi:hypothetical protein